MEKKLYKSNDKVISGVCGGIGEYFSVDPVIIRLLWVVFTLMAGAGLIAYIIAAIIMPIDPTYSSIERNYVRPDEEMTEDEAKEKMQARKNNRSSVYTLGIILILFGVIIFIRSYIPWIPEETFLAVLLIGIGAYFVFGRK
ncbi:MAG: PspC domain-containing protein [Clostridia bacterium]|nr:PspC domain-containing protein [Clostridia bacterium]